MSGAILGTFCLFIIYEIEYVYVCMYVSRNGLKLLILLPLLLKCWSYRHVAPPLASKQLKWIIQCNPHNSPEICVIGSILHVGKRGQTE